MKKKMSFEDLKALFDVVNIRASGPGLRKSGMTRRGATHKHGKVFLGRQILPMNPAQYRHYHFGKQKKDNGQQEKDNG